MNLRRFTGLTLFAALAIPPPAPAGTIDYEFFDINGPNPSLARMDVDPAAIARGRLTLADVTGFGFGLFGAADLSPFTFAIDAAGVPLHEGTIVGTRDFLGTAYFLAVDFGPSSFDPNVGGFYQSHPAGNPGVSGTGYWTATIVSAAVPEPAALLMSLIALACGIGLAARVQRTEE